MLQFIYCFFVPDSTKIAETKAHGTKVEEDKACDNDRVWQHEVDYRAKASPKYYSRQHQYCDVVVNQCACPILQRMWFVEVSHISSKGRHCLR